MTNDPSTPPAPQPEAVPQPAALPAAGTPPVCVRGPDRPDLLRDETLADLFEAIAAQRPHATALICGATGRTLTYADLEAQSAVVAHQLIVRGVRPGHIVGLWLPRGLDLLIMQLGIARAGAAWLPFDADVPVDRIGVCLDDAQAQGLVCAPEALPLLDGQPWPRWCSTDLLRPPEDGALQRRDGHTGTDPAYVIYTSGSTGKPKGILIQQASICHFLRSENAVLGVRGDDTVYQGFSVAFDMSFEEIWISYLVGASLWVAPKELVTDPDALPLALEQHGVTVLHAVPTLLALFNRDIATLRIINMGGEMCPDALVARLDREGLAIFNTYGPTEGTVSASLAQLSRGEAVTIGRPLPNYGMTVLDDQQRMLAQGEIGELCLFGPGVAQGYLGRPELTAEKFIPNPWALTPQEDRLYRTGDLARITETGEVQCLGRADDQIKIRGFRVELGEIEAALCEQPGVGTAAVLVREISGVDQLVAWLVLEHEATPEGASGSVVERPSASLLRAALRARLPEYMVPARYEMVDSLPRLLSGKIDRKALRAMELPDLPVEAGASDTPAGEAEILLFEKLAKIFPGQPLRRELDFFSDLGGHSLFAARLVSLLRTDPRCAMMTVQDVYQNRQVARIAQAVQTAMDAVQTDPGAQVGFTPSPNNSAWRRLRCGVGQLLALPFLVSIAILQWLAPFFTYHLYTGDPGDSIANAVMLALSIFVLVQIISLGLAVAGRRLILGRVKPGRYPLWGWVYYRWWLSDRLVNAAPLHLLNGSVLMSYYLRAVGARVGRDVALGSVTARVPSLLTIEDGASLGAAVQLENARIERGELVIGAIHIARDGYVGSYCVLEGNTGVGESARLEGLSSLTDGQTLPAHSLWGGAPALPLGSNDRSHLPARPPYTRARELFEMVFFSVSALAVAMLFFVPLFPTFMFVDWLVPDDPGVRFWHESGRFIALAIPASAVLIVLTALLSASVRWIALPRMDPGRYPLHGHMYYRKWLINQIQDTSLVTLHAVYATVFAPTWYRLLGARVGRKAEISTAMGVVPDMLTLGDETFIADAVMLGDDDIENGWMTLRPTVIGHRSFVGNGAYVPDGTVLPTNVLIGVQSRAPQTERLRPGDTWFGSPPTHLPAREVVTGFDDSLTFNPARWRVLGRTLVESARIVLPLAYSVGVGYAIVGNVIPLVDSYGHGLGWLVLMAYLASWGAMYGAGSMLVVLLLKWLLVGRYRAGSHPMWTPFVWLSEAVTNIYESMAVTGFLNYLRGTPMLPWVMRLFGARIGRGVYLDTTDMTEFDCVHIGDQAELNALSGPQTHLFEDRIMKIGTVDIGRGVTIRARTTVLYDARVEEGVHLGPLTLVMKGETLPAHTRWRGSPAEPWRD